MEEGEQLSSMGPENTNHQTPYIYTKQVKAGKRIMETSIGSSHDVIYGTLLKKDQEAEIARNSW